MNNRVVILENIRSAYNVGNIIRTADALGWQVWLCGYTPSPEDSQKVVKTSLGAEKNVGLMQFDSTLDAIEYARKRQMTVLAAEVNDHSLDIKNFSQKPGNDICVIFGNEVDGVLESTLKIVDHVVHIPMQGIKESLNVGQSSAIFMYALKVS